jgi:hypothetical protein
MYTPSTLTRDKTPHRATLPPPLVASAPEGVTVTPNNIIPTNSIGTVTFTNRAAVAVMLTLMETSTDDTVDPNQVTLRPGESAVITVTIDRTRLVAGRHYVFSVIFAPTTGVPVNMRLAFQG